MPATRPRAGVDRIDVLADATSAIVSAEERVASMHGALDAMRNELETVRSRLRACHRMLSWLAVNATPPTADE